jgi:HEAT repeat protein
LETAAEVERRSAIEGDKRGEELEKDCRRRAEAEAMGFLAMAKDPICLLAEHFNAFKGADVRGVLDVVLVHEMVHIFQQRVLGAKTPPGPRPACRAHAALREGHAEFVARRVAARLGLDAAFELLARPHAAERPAREKFSDFGPYAWHIFHYGDGERFFAALADRLGYAEAERRAFASPPRTMGQITYPPDYLNGVCSDAGRGLAKAVLALLGASDEKVYPIPPAVLRRRLAPAGPEAAVAWRGVRTTWAATPEVRYGALAGRAARLEITDTASAEVAERLFAALSRAVRAEGEELIAPGVLWEVFWAVHGDTEVDGAPMLRSSRVVREEDTASHANVESFVLLHDHRIVRLLVEMPREERTHLDRLARRALGLMRGEPQAGALNGGPEQRFLALVALESPDPRRLEKLVRDPDLDVRATALARATHLAVVRWALQDPSLRAQAARAAGRYAEAGPLLVTLLEDGNPRVRENALTALAGFRWAERVGKDELTARLDDPDPGVRRALLALVAKGKALRDKERLNILAVHTEDASAEVRLAAWTHLEEMKKHNDLPAGVWRRGLADRSAAVRCRAFRALGEMSFRSEGPLPEEEEARWLVRALHDDYWFVRWSSSWRISRFASHLEPFLPDLIAALQCEDTRFATIDALGEMRAKAKAAVPALLALADVRAVRRQVIETLGQISHRHDEVEAVLHAALEDHDVGTRLAAVRALEEIGATPPEDLGPLFLAVFARGDSISRRNAVEMLKERGDAGRALLLLALADPSDWVRSKAVEALLEGDRTPETVARAARLLLDRDTWVRQNTAWALRRLRVEAAPAVPLVIRAIRVEKDSDLLETYCDILESVGPAAREALPVLRELLEHANTEVRGEAREAIDSIERE